MADLAGEVEDFNDLEPLCAPGAFDSVRSIQAQVLKEQHEDLYEKSQFYRDINDKDFVRAMLIMLSYEEIVKLQHKVDRAEIQIANLQQDVYDLQINLNLYICAMAVGAAMVLLQAAYSTVMALVR